jgi:hypothetical protein
MLDRQQMRVGLDVLREREILLAVSPDLARKALESVRDSEIFPQAMDAGMMLRGLDDGSYVPS